MVWFNKILGRQGEWFWAFVIGLIAPVMMLTVLAGPVLAPGLQPIDRLLVAGSFAFVSYILILGVLALRTALRTARKIELAPSALYLSTFGGKTVCIDRSGDWQVRSISLTKKFHQLLFSKDQEHLVIADGKRSYYISAYTEGFDELAQKLGDYFHRSHD